MAEQLSSLAGQLPEGYKPPIMTPLTSSTGVVLVIGLTSTKLSLMDLRTTADWTIKQRLLSVPGVAGVAIFGEGIKQLQIQVRPDQLIRHNLAIEDVLAAARRATGVRGPVSSITVISGLSSRPGGRRSPLIRWPRSCFCTQNGANVT